MSLPPSPFFSTIIPVHNRTSLAISAIDSALAQSWTDQEVIVIDDGSTDDTVKVLEQRYAGRVRLLQQPNAGPGPARNTGIAEARGKYIAFLDSDDLWFPWALELHRRAIERYSPSLISGAEVQMSDLETVLRRGFVEPKMERFDDLLAACGEKFVVEGTPSVAVRTDELRRIGGFANNRLNAEDTDLWLRLGASVGFVKLADPPTFAVRHHAGRTSRDVRRTAQGISYLLQQERACRYPGGSSRRYVRRRLLGRFQRPASLDCIRAGAVSEGLRLYLLGLALNIRLGRFRYLGAVPLLASAAIIRRTFGARRSV
jgi:glycosyltransferase involved in cell wall biosynthesis